MSNWLKHDSISFKLDQIYAIMPLSHENTYRIFFYPKSGAAIFLKFDIEEDMDEVYEEIMKEIVKEKE